MRRRIPTANVAVARTAPTIHRDESGFQIRELDPTARRSQEYRLSRRSRRAKPGPGHAGHPHMDLYWRTLLVGGQSAPTRVGAARHRRAAEHPPLPGVKRRRRTP